MSNQVLFYMCQSQKDYLIAEHRFYVEQAKKRVLSQFENIEHEARIAAEEWLSSRYFDPYHDDPDSFGEDGWNYEVHFHQLLSDMHDRTRLSVIAGMFHEWEKQLREWLVKEIRHWHWEEGTQAAIWSAKNSEIFQLFELLGWKLTDAEFFKEIDACRLVVNVYKHGKGSSFTDLKRLYPEYLRDVLAEFCELSLGTDYLNHNHLVVNNDQFQRFSEAIIAFWCDMPERIYAPFEFAVPSWLNGKRKNRV